MYSSLNLEDCQSNEALSSLDDAKKSWFQAVAKFTDKENNLLPIKILVRDIHDVNSCELLNQSTPNA